MTCQPVSRRDFLTAAAAPLLVPAAALGSPARAAASERVTVAVIGVGRQTRFVNLKQLLAMPDVQVVAVCDVDAWRLANAKAQVEEAYGKAQPSGRFKGCDAHADYRDVLARKDVDAVMIATPDHWHAPMALAAFAAGKDVSLEKPITRTVAEGRELSDEAARLKRVFRVDSEMRSNPHIHRAATMVRNGVVGQVKRVTVGVPFGDRGYKFEPAPDMPVPEGLDYERWQGPAPRAAYTERRVHKPRAYDRPGWMRHLTYCDGMITNWGSHFNDVAMWATDLERNGPVEVEAKGTFPPQESFWNVLLDFECRYRFANGVEWVYRTESASFKVEGTEGWVASDGTKVEAGPASLLSWKPGPNATAFRLKSDKADFVDCVKSRGETLEPAEVGHRVTSLCHLGHIAVRLGRKLRWDPKAERFAGDEAANAWLDRPMTAPGEA